MENQTGSNPLTSPPLSITLGNRSVNGQDDSSSLLEAISDNVKTHVAKLT